MVETRGRDLAYGALIDQRRAIDDGGRIWAFRLLVGPATSDPFDRAGGLQDFFFGVGNRAETEAPSELIPLGTKGL